MINDMNQRVTLGFTLVEMTVVLVIVGLLLTGLILPISAQIEMQAYRQTNKNLEEIREALIGYAMMNGRLPCPATATSSGLEDTVGGGVCAAKIAAGNWAVGYLPAATLGITPTDDQGFAVDGWGRNAINRIRYAVTTKTVNSFTDPFTTVNGMANATISEIANNQPYLTICSAAPVGVNCGGSKLSDSAVFVIYSVGKNASTGGSGDESANPNPNTADADGNGVPDADDGIFVSRDSSPSFDDVVLWASTPTLISRMVSSGKLS